MGFSPFRAVSLVLFVLLAPAFGMRRPGDEIRPGFNLFTKQQDIEIGAEVAAQVRRQYPAVKSDELQRYLRSIGDRLASQKEARESGFTFSFTLVNDKAINAFALPGGPAFVFTGLMRAAENEGQIAGVLGHEMSHVILRHGTNQASKANLLQIPAILAGAVTGSNLFAQLTSLGAIPFLLKFSRTDETEADALGARLMNEAGYNPIEMARFFENCRRSARRSRLNCFPTTPIPAIASPPSKPKSARCRKPRTVRPRTISPTQRRLSRRFLSSLTSEGFRFILMATRLFQLCHPSGVTPTVSGQGIRARLS